jgi:hypothetical protein
MAMGEDKLAMTDLDAAVLLNKRSDLLSLANRYGCVCSIHIVLDTLTLLQYAQCVLVLCSAGSQSRQ